MKQSTRELNDNLRAALGLDRVPPKTLVDAVNRECGEWLGHPVQVEMLDSLATRCYAAAYCFASNSYAVSLSRFTCRAFFPPWGHWLDNPLRNIPGMFRDFEPDMIVRDPESLERTVPAGRIRTEPGMVQVLFRDPLGIWCDAVTLERMVKERWNEGLGWWG